MTDESWEDARYLNDIEDEFKGLAFDIKAIQRQFRSKLVYSRVAPSLKKMVGFFEFVDAYLTNPDLREECGDLGIIFGDIADFKNINSRAGMAVGDQVIRIVGETLYEFKAQFGKAYRIHDAFHISGDEFLMVVSASKVRDVGAVLVSEIEKNSTKLVYRYFEGQVEHIESFRLGFGAASLRPTMFSDGDFSRKQTEQEIWLARKQAELACFVAKVTGNKDALVGFCHFEDVPSDYLEPRITERPKCSDCKTQFSFDVREKHHEHYKKQPFRCPVCVTQPKVDEQPVLGVPDPGTNETP
jgi:GGDEF domain-containing protein